MLWLAFCSFTAGSNGTRSSSVQDLSSLLSEALHSPNLSQPHLQSHLSSPTFSHALPHGGVTSTSSIKPIQAAASPAISTTLFAQSNRLTPEAKETIVRFLSGNTGIFLLLDIFVAKE